eukprot:TRINITY_DN1204_c0_g1_i1.p1 TRINITY_DN1204_c0_g1~~TRINITY_DN1204_c0_g1_i1.p1  ORF type:complete len:470 (-),score=142.37 TRINITY_DN1204_c0_g1_i1:928-2337(-)
MALVNIGEDNRNDGFYRYKMPRLVTKIEGRGNGIKTNIVNMVDVAKALARSPAYTTKFFGCVLGAQSKFDEKTATATVNGAHDTSKLVQLLEGFIKKYVQCYGCGNPETEIVITKTQMITLKCAACGFLSDVDMRDKLTTFILNNPPEKKAKGTKLRKAEKERLEAGKAADEAAKKSSGKKDGAEGGGAKKSSSKKKEKDELAESSQKDEEHSRQEAEDDDDDVEWQTDTSAAAAEARIREQLSAATAGMVMLSTEDAGAENPKAAKSKTTKAENGKAKAAGENGVGNGGSSHHEEADDNDADEEGKEEEDDGGHRELVGELRDYAETHTLLETATYVQKKGEPSQALILALFEALFGGIAKGLSKEITKKKDLLAKVLPDGAAQLRFLHALELYCGVTKVEAIKEVPLALKALYDGDVVEEEQVLGWDEQKGGAAFLGVDAKAAAAVREAAAPYVKWLREAESESEEE